MLPNLCQLFRRSALVGVTSLLRSWRGHHRQGRVTRIIIDTKVSPAFNGEVFGSAGQYEDSGGELITTACSL